jgi:hypothetical protein
VTLQRTHKKTQQKQPKRPAHRRRRCLLVEAHGLDAASIGIECLEVDYKHCVPVEQRHVGRRMDAVFRRLLQQRARIALEERALLALQRLSEARSHVGPIGAAGFGELGGVYGEECFQLENRNVLGVIGGRAPVRPGNIWQATALRGLVAAAQAAAQVRIQLEEDPRKIFNYEAIWYF